MGPKQSKFQTLLWNDSNSIWVPTLVVLQNGQFRCYNLKTSNFIMGVNLSTAYRLFVFGPLCKKMTWLPPLFPGGNAEVNLLGVPTSQQALENSRLMYWFYFGQAKNITVLLESAMDMLDKQNVQRYIPPAKPPTYVAVGQPNYVNLTPMYYQGFGCGWSVGGARVWEPHCFNYGRVNSTVIVDRSFCPDVYTTYNWGSPYVHHWDTSGYCGRYDVQTNNFNYVHNEVNNTTIIQENNWGSNDTSAYRGSPVGSTTNINAINSGGNAYDGISNANNNGAAGGGDSFGGNNSGGYGENSGGNNAGSGWGGDNRGNDDNRGNNGSGWGGDNRGNDDNRGNNGSGWGGDNRGNNGSGWGGDNRGNDDNRGNNGSGWGGDNRGNDDNRGNNGSDWGGNNSGGYGDNSAGSGWGGNNSGGYGDNSAGSGWGGNNSGGYGDNSAGSGWGGNNSGGYGDNSAGSGWGSNNSGDNSGSYGGGGYSGGGGDFGGGGYSGGGGDFGGGGYSGGGGDFGGGGYSGGGGDFGGGGYSGGGGDFGGGGGGDFGGGGGGGGDF